MKNQTSNTHETPPCRVGDVSGMCFLRWTKKKPKPNKECVLIVATLIAGKYDYDIFQILKTDFDDKWYWGIIDRYGDEWGDYSDLKADLYYAMPLLKAGSKKHFR